MERLIKDDMERCISFYDIYFQNRSKTEEFIDSIFSCDDIDLAPRQMMNMLYRWGSLAKDIEKLDQQEMD